MLERDREKKEPWMFPPSEQERFLMEFRDEKEARRRRYFAFKRRSKGGRYETSSNGS